MFGSGFGAPASQAPAFGSTTSTFGSPFGAAQPQQTAGLFGQPAAQPAQQSAFGTTSAFGTSSAFGQPQQQQQQTTGIFGSAPAATPFGGAPAFGQPAQPAQSGTSLFGGGTTTGSGLFGQQTNTGGSIFGQPAQPQQQTSGLFGQSSTAGSLFGSTAAKPAFGGGTAFGAPAQPAQTTSLFGQPQQQPQSSGLFGQTSGTSGGLFGGASSGLFGASAAQPAGTGHFKFEPVTGSDTAMKNNVQTSIQTKNFCICCMKQVDEKKSMEELRLEDYAAGRKFGTATALPGASGLFGQQPQQATSAFSFGQQQQQKPAGFGATGSLFGQQPAQPATGGLFGQSTAQPAQSGSLFGGATFGQPSQPAQTTSAFSFSTPATTASATPFGSSAFGQQNKPFGAAAPFGQTATTAAQPSAFGGSGLFGAPAASQPSAFAGFGTTTQTTQASAFGKPMFPSTAPTTTPAFSGFGTANTSMFGAKPATTTAPSFFGNTTTTTGTTSAFGGFGTGGFGSSTATQPAQTGQPSTTQPTMGFGASASQPAVQSLSSPQSPSGNVHAQIIELMRKGSSDTEALSNMYPQLPVSQEEKRPAPLSKDAINQFISNAQRTFAGSAKKDVKIGYYAPPAAKANGLTMNASNGPLAWRHSTAKRDEKFRLDKAYIEKLESELNEKTRMQQDQSAQRVIAPKATNVRSTTYSALKPTNSGTAKKTGSPVEVVNFNREINLVENSAAAFNGNAGMNGDREGVTERGGNVFTLTKPGYYTIPDVSEIVLDQKGQCIVDDFYIGRYSYGGVRFPGKTNVAGLNLDAIVQIEDKEVTLYPDEENKPPVGKGLNKHAIVTFENIKPTTDDGADMTSDEIEQSGFVELLKARIEAMGDAQFVNYETEKSELSFSVKHFSKYKLVLDDASAIQMAKKMKTSPLVPKEMKVKKVEMKESGDLSSDSLKENAFGGATLKEGNMKERTVLNAIFTVEDDEMEQSTIEETKEMLPFVEIDDNGMVEMKTGFASIGKRAIGAIAWNSVGSLTVVKGAGEDSLTFGVSGEPELSYDSKILVEELFETYLAHSRLDVDKTRILAPEATSTFIADFIEALTGLIDPSIPIMVHEKILFDLVSVLYVQSIPGDQQCRMFADWLKFSVSALQGLQPPVEKINREDVQKAIFMAVLAGDVHRAADIAVHFGLCTMAVVLDHFSHCSGNIDQQVVEIIRDTLDQFLQDSVAQNDEATVYLMRSLMLLSGKLFVTDEKDEIVYSVFSGLNWLEAFAASTLYMVDVKNPVTGIDDILRRYLEHASWNPDCVLPTLDAEIPPLIFQFIVHFCRHSLPPQDESFEQILLKDSAFDIRTRWFLSRMMEMCDDSIDEDADCKLTSKFANALGANGFPHLAAVALKHLPESVLRRSEMRVALMGLGKRKVFPERTLLSILKFLESDPVAIEKSLLAEVRAVIALNEGQKVEALNQYFYAEQYGECLKLIVDYVIPTLASGGKKTYVRTLEGILVADSDCPALEPYLSFLHMLQISLRIKVGNLLPETFDALERTMEVVLDGREHFDASEEKHYLLTGFLARKMKEARAFLALKDF